MESLFPVVTVDQLLGSGSGVAVSEEARAVATEILQRLQTEHAAGRGEAELRAIAARLGDLTTDVPLTVERDALETALRSLDPTDRSVLERTAERIRAFAEHQQAALRPVDVDVLGGRAGHEIAPVAAAGCYAPGGRYPLPSSVLMTAVTAKVAGVETVVVASPRPTPITLAAAAIAGANQLLACGGAHAIAAMATGIAVPRCDVIAGPGNRYVTAAKQLVAGQVGIDMLAGPSELVVLADDTADPERIAADLLAQAEHDPDARPILVTTDASQPARVVDALERQLATLATSPIARQSLRRGGAIVAADLAEACDASNRLAPEHLQVLTKNPKETRGALHHWGGLFLGAQSAEVFGDYGVGPNHTLPTGGTARFTGGLSVFSFLRIRTWLHLDESVDARLTADTAHLARLEGLEAHARAAEQRGPR